MVFAFTATDTDSTIQQADFSYQVTDATMPPEAKTAAFVSNRFDIKPNSPAWELPLALPEVPRTSRSSGRR